MGDSWHDSLVESLASIPWALPMLMGVWPERRNLHRPYSCRSRVFQDSQSHGCSPVRPPDRPRGRPHAAHVAPDDRRDQSSPSSNSLHNLGIRGFDHGVGRSHQTNQPFVSTNPNASMTPVPLEEFFVQTTAVDKKKKSRRGRTPGGIRPRRLTRQPAPRAQPGCSLSSHPTTSLERSDALRQNHFTGVMIRRRAENAIALKG